MNVANLELCKELYELSGWGKTQVNWAGIDGDWGYEYADLSDLQDDRDIDEAFPAYDLGYLLRKLQVTSTREWSNGWLGYEVKFFWDEIDKDWVAQFKNTDIDDDKMFEGVPGLVRYNESADTPEDAAAKLAIELFKQGVLMKESNRE